MSVWPDESRAYDEGGEEDAYDDDVCCGECADEPHDAWDDEEAYDEGGQEEAYDDDDDVCCGECADEPQDAWDEEEEEEEDKADDYDEEEEEGYLEEGWEEGEEEFAEEDPAQEDCEVPQERSKPPQNKKAGTRYLHLRPQDVRFSQATIKQTFQNDVTLDETLGQLASKCTAKRAVNMIRVVKHQGQIFTLDNRRLAVFRLLSILGEVRGIKVRVVEKTQEWHQKFNTGTDGTVVRVRGTKYIIGMDKSSTTFPLDTVRDLGGDSSAVQVQLQDVRQIQACSGAFAAIRRDGSVVTWGHPPCGGDSSSVQSQLQDVWSIQSTGTAFVATLRKGGLVAWGNMHHGGVL
ncbi:gacGG [Symbiodinium sp. CCMP2592]|nr:gacGG [Symbiodinium sp. CCMP2592]